MKRTLSVNSCQYGSTSQKDETPYVYSRQLLITQEGCVEHKLQFLLSSHQSRSIIAPARDGTGNGYPKTTAITECKIELTEENRNNSIGMQTCMLCAHRLGRCAGKSGSH